MNPLTIEIHGTGTHNRGAELMAIAAAARMRASFPGARIVVPPQFGDAVARGRHGFLTTWEIPGRLRSKISNLALRFGSPGAQRMLGVVDPANVDVVLDASGFAFSDQWGERGAELLLRKMNGAERRGKPLILLPQALGPFERPEVAAASRALFQRAALVCARDSKSHLAAKQLGVEAGKLRQFPDFTVGLKKASLPPELVLPEQFAAIVPNVRMLDKGSSASGYLDFIARAIDLLQARGMNPVLVLHDADEDRKVIDLVRAGGRDLPVVEHDDPLVLKAILGRASLVLGSRFHALVSSLSQGTPCIGAGWSHKYPELFADFDCSDLLISDLADATALREAVDQLASPEAHLNQQKRIQAAAGPILAANERMWQEVEGHIRRIS